MSQSQSIAASTRKLLSRVTCPHCWEQFRPEDSLWISEHSDLLGDPRLGPEHQQRFLPTRFTVGAEAVDAKGFACHQLACPNCHLNVPWPLLEMEPLFLSIFGAPASGKSYFLAAMSWELRKILPQKFRVGFADADPVMNQYLNQYEESLFGSADGHSLIPLASLIRKTEEQGDLYDTVSFGAQSVTYPRPFLFSLQPQQGHPNVGKGERLSRVACLYDNAGESFLPGKDSAASPVTRHMAQSRVLFFVFDPMQDNRFQARATRSQGHVPQHRTFRQEPVLQEAAARIRKYAGIPQNQKHKRPLIVILTKYDEWSSMMGELPTATPWKEIPTDRASGGSEICALDVATIERQSDHARERLLKYSPEIVSAAENFAQDVVYVPVSAVGWRTRFNEPTRQLAIRPVDTEPYWVTVPLLYALCRWTPGLIPIIKQK